VAGNFYPDYKDASGSIKRRLLAFNFTNFIQNRDTTLKEKIKKKELITVMCRCILRYRTVCEQFKGMDFWTQIAPEALRNEQNEIHQNTSPLAAYLANGDDYAQITYVKGSVTELDELEKLYSNHMKFKHDVKGSKIGDDMYPIKSAGYEVKPVNLCKTCHK
jgi:hypothetical protein